MDGFLLDVSTEVLDEEVGIFKLTLSLPFKDCGPHNRLLFQSLAQN